MEIVSEALSSDTLKDLLALMRPPKDGKLEIFWSNKQLFVFTLLKGMKRVPFLVL